MYTSPAQFSELNAAAFDTIQTLTQKSIEGIEKLTALNVATLKNAITDSSEQFQALLAAKDPKAFADVATSAGQPNAERITVYGKEVYAIVSETSGELNKLFEKQFTENGKKLNAAIESFSKSAPGSEGFVNFFKQAVGAANSAYEQASKATKQAAEYAASNIEAVATPPARGKK
ncbi:MAG TPA: phasin family protein [Burkholderiaceae bacterium]|nr:phasin family protein [Burkholderiaceae bacterium]